jgi:hypothetical protein
MSYKCHKCGFSLMHEYETCLICGTFSAGRKSAYKIGLALATMNLKIANEQATSKKDAYNSGYGLNFLTKNPLAFKNSLNEKGQIKKIFFDNPYLMDKLNNAYRNGVWDRVRSELNGQLSIPWAIEKYTEQAYAQGLEGQRSLQFEINVHFLINCTLTTERTYINGSPYHYNHESCVYSFTPNSCTSPFTNPVIWSRYLKGIEKFVELKNSPTELSFRREELRKRKSDIRIKNVSWPILYIFSIYMVYWLWAHNHGFFAILQVCAIGVAVYSFIDDGVGDDPISFIIFQAFRLSLALAAFGVYSYFF